MKKIIKKIGKDSRGIIFNKEEVKINNLDLGKVIDLSDMVVTDEIIKNNE